MYGKVWPPGWHLGFRLSYGLGWTLRPTLIRTLSCLADALDEHLALVRIADDESFDLVQLQSGMRRSLVLFNLPLKLLNFNIGPIQGSIPSIHPIAQVLGHNRLPVRRRQSMDVAWHIRLHDLVPSDNMFFLCLGIVPHCFPPQKKKQRNVLG